MQYGATSEAGRIGPTKALDIYFWRWNCYHHLIHSGLGRESSQFSMKEAKGKLGEQKTETRIRPESISRQGGRVEVKTAWRWPERSELRHGSLG
jgi:hypothetical protein